MDQRKEKLSNNLEDYLEAISSLADENGYARPSDIAAALHVKKPSVTSALNALAQLGLVKYEKYRPVSLTKEGKKVAANISKKHKLLSGFFTSVLGVDAADADAAACKMEHSLGDGMMRRLTSFIKNLSGCAACPAHNSGGCSCACPQSVTLDTLKEGEEGMVVELGGKAKANAAFGAPGISVGTRVKMKTPSDSEGCALVLVGGAESKLRLKKAQLKQIGVKKL